MAVDKELFRKVTGLVIDKLEGGYYNPSYHNTGDNRYNTSGETMFGIDRRQGGSINTSAAGQQFWSLIDSNKSKSVWHWNYIPGEPLKSKLKILAADMMFDAYNSFAKFSMSNTLRGIVESDARLLFHFIYAAWNGAGWFLKFSHDMDAALKSGISDSTKLVQIAINSRTKEGYTKGSAPNSLIAQGGAKIAEFINSVPGLIGVAENIVKEEIKVVVNEVKKKGGISSES